MALLLSTGEYTTSQVTYIADIFKLNLSIDPNEIPYIDNGIESRVDELDFEEFKNTFDSSIKSFLSSLKTRTEITANVTLDSIDYQESKILVKLNINGEVITNEIKNTNSRNF